MLKRLLLALIAVVAVTTATAVPAQAACANVTYVRFWTHSICMAIGDTGLNAPYIAQQWNIKGGMAIQASNNCVTAGYPPSRRFTIDTYYDAGGPFWKVRGPNGAQPGLDAYNGWWRYTDNPVLWVNTAYLFGSVQKPHIISAAIGNLLGLSTLNSSGYNSRVMNFTAWSVQNVPYPEYYSGGLLESIYNEDCT